MKCVQLSKWQVTTWSIIRSSDYFAGNSWVQKSVPKYKYLCKCTWCTDASFFFFGQFCIHDKRNWDQTSESVTLQTSSSPQTDLKDPHPNKNTRRRLLSSFTCYWMCVYKCTARNVFIKSPGRIEDLSFMCGVILVLPTTNTKHFLCVSVTLRSSGQPNRQIHVRFLLNNSYVQAGRCARAPVRFRHKKKPLG